MELRVAGIFGAMLMLFGSADPAWAQLVHSQPGSTRGLFGGHRTQNPARTSNRWTVRVDLSGGRNTVPVEVAPPTSEAPALAETAGTATISTQFWRGRTGRFIEINGGGAIHRQSLATEQLRSASGSVRAQRGVGARLDLSGVLSVSYQPLRISSQLGDPGLSDVSAASQDLAAPRGVIEQPWVSTMATGTISRRWTPRQRTDIGFTGLRVQPIEGPGYGTRSESMSLREAWNMTSRIELSAGYNYGQNRQAYGGGDAIRPTTIHSATAGLRVERRVSPVRTLTIALRGGAAYSESFGPGDSATASSLVPVVSGTFQANLSRTFTLSLGASREVTVLSGITAQPFTTDQASGQITGRLTRRLNVGLSGAYSRGTTAANQPGSFDAATGTAQLQYGMARCCGMFTSYSYYQHRLRDINAIPVGFPGGYGRHAVRVGVSVWVPLYGTF